MDVLAALHARYSVRAFLNTPVSDELIIRILEAARYAPSGVNHQPWQVAIVKGQTQQKITQALIAAREQNVTATPDYDYYPKQWHEPYAKRRKECGIALYKALQIQREDLVGREQAWRRNYQFFAAPVGLLFMLDEQLAQGSWVDMGMFIQSVMLAAIDLGLGTCPQAALAEYPDIIRSLLDLPQNLQVICGVSLGYVDEHHPANSYRLARAPVETFTKWYA